LNPSARQDRSHYDRRYPIIVTLEQEYNTETFNVFADKRRKKSIFNKKPLSLTEQLDFIELLKSDCEWFNDATLADRDGYMLRLYIAKRRLNP
jgi:hypothetical protein